MPVAQRAVNALIEDGFLSGDVSVLMPDQRSTREFARHREILTNTAAVDISSSTEISGAAATDPIPARPSQPGAGRATVPGPK
jgi:hypothetical protein